MRVKINTKTKITQEQLLKLNAHIGAANKAWNPYTAKYLMGQRNKNYIVNLTHTVILIKRALLFITKINNLFGFTAFVNQEPFMKSKVIFSNKRMYFFQEKWHPGLLTNFKEVIRRYTDKTLEHNFATTGRLPQAIFLAQTKPNYWAINEARSIQIPIIALIETEFNPNIATFPIPCNSSSPVLLQLFIELYEAAVSKGKIERFKNVYKSIT